MSPPAAGIAAAQIKVKGQPLDPNLAPLLQEVRVEDNLTLPDTFLLRLSDPGMRHMDTSPFEVGAEVEIAFGAPEANRLSPMLVGQIAAVEPEFRSDGVSIVARGYDHSHALNRSRRNATYQDTTVDEIVRKVAQNAGMEVGTVEAAGGTQKFVQQSNETDWEFLWRLANRVGGEVLVIDRKLHFRPAGGGEAGGEAPILRYGDSLLSFRPRISGVQQVDEVVVRSWDHTATKAIEAVARVEGERSTIGVARSAVASALSGGKLAVADAPVTTQEEADALARSVATRVANGYVEADGACRGDPRIRAGGEVKVEGVGSRFSGTYRVSSTTHVLRGAAGYETRFRITGGSSRSLVELMAPPARGGWQSGGVQVAVVTQNEDPSGLGRVRIKYPELGEETEGWWARVVSPGAGKDRGLMMIPVVGDEVLIAFEHGDTRRPYVLGSLWNGQDTPGDLVQSDGSFRLRSAETLELEAMKSMAIKAADGLEVKVGSATITVKKDGTVTVEGKDVTVKGSGSVSVEADGSLKLKAGGSMTIEAGATLKVSGAQVTLG